MHGHCPSEDTADPNAEREIFTQICDASRKRVLPLRMLKSEPFDKSKTTNDNEKKHEPHPPFTHCQNPNI
jgi:hypothetical protein